jgi:hypothetical protein
MLWRYWAEFLGHPTPSDDRPGGDGLGDWPLRPRLQLRGASPNHAGRAAGAHDAYKQSFERVVRDLTAKPKVS